MNGKILHNIALLWIFIGIILSVPRLLSGQYEVKGIEVGKRITLLETEDDGRLKYGTSYGEIGKFDGLIFEKAESFEGQIHALKKIQNEEYVLTSKGLFLKKNGKNKALTGNTLNVLDISSDTKLLLTTSGVYRKDGKEYKPDREEFYNINSITKGQFLKIGDDDVLRIDDKIYIFNRGWKEIVIHRNDFNLYPFDNEKIIIANDKSLITITTEGIVDTLLKFESDHAAKVYKIDNSQYLLGYDNNISLFNINTKSERFLHPISTDLMTAFVKDEWDNLWLSAGSYLYKFIPENATKTRPRLSITQIKVNGTKQDVTKPIVLKSGSNDLEITYKGVYLASPFSLQYQHKTTSSSSNYTQMSADWSLPSKKEYTEIRNLPAGSYEFELKASIDKTYYTYAKPIQFSVQDNSILWIWLTAVLGALAVLLTTLYFNARYVRLKKKSAAERNQLKQQNNMLTLQQKALQLQMNPHFIFNALNSIQGLIATEDNKNARLYLQDFSSLMRSMLNQSREDSIRLEEETKYLNSYLRLEKMANNNSFDFIIEVDDSLEDDIKIPTMVVQPFIENAIIHGVKRLNARRGNIKVHFQDKDQYINCVVSDNGRGREEAAKNRKSNHKPVALKVAKDRLSFQLPIKNIEAIKYTDLKENGLGAGTKVEIRIPIV